MDAGVTSRSLAAMVLWELGYPDRALEKSREALSLAREVSHPFSLVYAPTFAWIIDMWRGELQAALESAEALIDLSGTRVSVLAGRRDFVSRPGADGAGR
jgi:hypothetical protein